MPLTTFHETTPLSKELTLRIAAEVYDAIIDHLHSFKPILSSCSTVCKSWLPACRYHLFYGIDLSPELVKLLCSSAHAMETVTPYLQNVALGRALSMAQRDSFDMVVPFLLNLDNLRGLSLGTRSWSFFGETFVGLLNAEGNLFQDVTTLRLQYLQFQSFSLLTAFVGRFPMLKDLSFDNVIWDPVESSLTSVSSGFNYRTTPPRRLKTLHIRSFSLVKPILLWLFGDNGEIDSEVSLMPSLRSLAIPDIPASDINVVGTVLRVLGSSLHHVEVGFLTHNHDDVDMRNLPKVMNLSHNENLRTLHIHHLTLYQFPQAERVPSSIAVKGSTDCLQMPPSLFFWLVPFLTEISSPAILTLAFSAWLSDETCLDLIDWPAMSQVLSNPVFGGLKTLQFRVRGLGPERHDLQTWLLARLSAWKASENAVRVLFLDD
ncbi:hypothetical protein FPV67DRAFT_1415843 [Lyophyllum atratum]|nr:hypothetical protein FPV67DRAFT_1415843 [Lyophyllum atratum]